MSELTSVPVPVLDAGTFDPVPAQAQAPEPVSDARTDTNLHSIYGKMGGRPRGSTKKAITQANNLEQARELMLDEIQKEKPNSRVIRALERLLMSFDRELIHKDSEAKDDKIKQLEAELEKTKISDAERSDLHWQQDRLRERQAEFDKQKTECENLRARNTELEHEIASVRSECEQTISTIQNATKKIASLLRGVSEQRKTEIASLIDSADINRVITLQAAKERLDAAEKVIDEKSQLDRVISTLEGKNSAGVYAGK